MKQLALSVPKLNDATSFYRAAYPLGDLRRQCKNIGANQPATWSEGTIRMTDGAFFQRPFKQDHLDVMLMCKEVANKVWVDYDDNLLDVPADNPTFESYTAAVEVVKKILQLADIVTVSTPALKRAYDIYNKNIVVVPNALDTSLRFVKERVVQPRKKIIAWRGSKTHHRDVFTYAREILQASRDKKNSDWQWYFIGDNLWFCTGAMPHEKTFHVPALQHTDYFYFIQKLAPTAFHVPLFDSDFNKAKSNIAWIEATFAGAVAIAPDWEEWRRPGVLQYGSEEGYLEMLNKVAAGEMDTEALVKNSWEYIMDCLTLEKVNKLRIDVLCELFGCTRSDLGCDG